MINHHFQGNLYFIWTDIKLRSGKVGCRFVILSHYVINLQNPLLKILLSTYYDRRCVGLHKKSKLFWLMLIILKVFKHCHSRIGSLTLIFPPFFILQVLFLMYHYFAATEIYNAIRMFIAAYVWMTGFGNFSYYYVRKDFSLGRFAQVWVPLMWGLQNLIIISSTFQPWLFWLNRWCGGSISWYFFAVSSSIIVICCTIYAPCILFSLLWFMGHLVFWTSTTTKGQSLL